MTEKRCCCSKEPLGSIPIARVVDKLDALLAENDIEEAARLLEYWEREARALCDKRGLLEILSEEVGFYRTAANSERGLAAADEALLLLAEECEHGVASATIYLNCATTLRAFGRVSDAMQYYDKAKEIYDRLLAKDDFRMAGFYNNYATALCALHRYNEARECYMAAINVLNGVGAFHEIAVTYVNLASLAYDEAEALGTECDDEVERLLELAMKCLDDDRLARDAGYAHSCMKCAEAFGFFGFFLQKQELERRARDIYAKNK